MSEPALQLVAVHRRYVQAGGGLHVLRGASLRLERGEAVALVGPSGAGKSTLLHIAGLLEAPDGGEVLVDGEDCARMGDSRRTLVRRRKLGFVYQFHHLLPEFTALDNVAMPLRIRRLPVADARAQALQTLHAVGLGDRALHRPAELSGGERQRVAVARALVTRPACILADEPTGNLDRRTADAVFELLLQRTRAEGAALLVVTHDESLARRCDRRLQLAGGRVVDDGLDRHSLSS